MSLEPEIAALLASELNPEQNIAAAAGPAQALRIIAGPGTGKTKTLAYRFLALTAGRNLPPNAVLALTFTEKAAAEMEERVRLLLPSQYRSSRLWISTFHAFAARLLHEAVHFDQVEKENRSESQQAASLLNELDRQLLQNAVFAEILALPGLFEQYPTLDFSEAALLSANIFAAIERLRDAYQAPSDLLPALSQAVSTWEEQSRLDLIRLTVQVYALYRQRLIEQSRLDFPELVYRAYFTLKDNAALRDRYQQRFVHILVDEFQDTSLSQLEFLRLLSPRFENVTVVGDRKQAIYGWRNARPENFEDAALLQSFSQALTRNYRSHQAILDVAAVVLRPLVGKIAAEELSLVAHRAGPSNATPSVIVARPADVVPKEDGLKAEATYIAAQIKQLRQEPGGAAKSLAILLRSVRTGSQNYEEALREAGIEYITVGGGGFYDQQEVLDLIALLRLLCDPADGQAFYRLANSPLFRLGQKLLLQLAAIARREAFYSEEKEPLFERSASFYLMTLLPGHQREILESLLELVRQGRAEMKNRSSAEMVRWALESAVYHRFFESRPPGERAQTEANCHKLQALAAAFEQAEPKAGLPELVAYLTLWLESDLPEQEAPAQANLTEANPVQIMTVHQSKGLEFDTVFVARQKPFKFQVGRPGQPGPLFVYLPDQTALFPSGFALLNYFDPADSKLRHGPDYEAYRELEKARALEEERYILYVALTRARSLLYLTSPISLATERSSKKPPENFFFREISDWANSAPGVGVVSYQ